MKIVSMKEIIAKEKECRVVLVCGSIGGGTIGYSSAGMDACLSVDSNSKNNVIHERNFEHVKTLEQSVELIAAEHIISADPRLEKEIDVLDIYIPVKQIESFNQNRFFVNVLKLAYQLKPKIVVMHTQGHLDKGKNILVLNELLALLKSIGYIVQKETLKASNYGIAQDKSWTFIVGVRKDIGIKPVFPEANEHWVSTEEAIRDLIDMPSDVEVNPTRLELVEKHFPPGCSYAEVKRITNELELPIHPAFYKRDRWNEPYYALPNSSTRPFHPLKNRLMTIAEAKRLQSFPDDFECTEWKEISSSVPPLIVHHVAKCLKRDILKHL